MKICFYGEIFSSLMGENKGGGELQISLIATQLARLGHKVLIIETKKKPNQQFSNIEFVYCPITSISGYFRLFSLIFKQDYDVLYGRIRDWKHFFVLLITKYKKKKFVLGLAHDLDVSSIRKRLKFFYNDNSKSLSYYITTGLLTELFFPLAVKYSHLVIAQHYDQLQFIKNKNKCVIGNICPKINKIPCVNMKYDYIFIGQLDVRKGVKQLLETIKRLNNKKFMVIGREKNSKLITRELQKCENVEYYEFIPHEKIYLHIAESKALVSTSNMEGFPNVFLEAWSCVKPVISLNVNPGDIFGKYPFLGKSMCGDLELFIKYLADYEPVENDPHLFYTYLENNHSINNVITIAAKMEELYA